MYNNYTTPPTPQTHSPRIPNARRLTISFAHQQKKDGIQAFHHSLALFSRLRRLFPSRTLLSSAMASSLLSVGNPTACEPLAPFFFLLLFSAPMAWSNSRRPRTSVSRTTRVLTVAPSRRFLPSRRLEAIFSVKTHRRDPRARSSPVAGSRGGCQSGARRSRGGILVSLDLTTSMMPSSSKRWYEFLSVSLLTASKYERSPWW